MSNNLTYGGIIYPDNSFVFDKIYNNFYEASEDVGFDTVLVGRYILVAYCDTAFTKDERTKIESNWDSIAKPTPDEQAYHDNFITDGGETSKDRKVYRKTYQNNEYKYQEVASLHSDLSNDSIAVLGIPADDKILQIDNDTTRILSSALDLDYTTDRKLQLIGKNNVLIKDIQVAQMIQDHLSIDDYLKWDNDNSKFYIDLTNLVDDSNKILNMNNEKIGTELSIEYINDPDNIEYHQHIVLKGQNGHIFSSFNAQAFVKDSYLSKVEYIDDNTLRFIFITENGEKQVVDTTLDIMDPGDGITIKGNEISAKTSGNYLTVDTNGIHTTGDLDNAINTAKSEAIASTKNTVKIVTNEEAKGVGTNVGDICIVKTPIYIDTKNEQNSKYSYTAYVWTNPNWEAMDGNYNAENVYFDEDIVITTQVGNIDLTNGQGKIPAQGKNLKQIFESLWTKEDLELSITNPTISLTISSNVSGEVGATFTRPTATIAVAETGSYEYGSKDAEGNVYSRDDGTGIVFEWLKVGYGTSSEEALDSASAYTDTDTSVSYTATNTDISVAKFTDTEQTYYFWGQGSYPDAVRRPVTNLGNFIDNKGIPTTEYSEGQQYIKGTVLEQGNANKATWKATGYRNWYIYVGNDLGTINSNFIRGCTSKGNAKNANDISLDITKGTKRVMIALPTGNLTENSTTITGYNKRLKSCIDVGGMGLDIFNANPSKFVQSVVSVADASGQNNMDYIVYIYENVNGLAATTLNIDIG